MPNTLKNTLVCLISTGAWCHAESFDLKAMRRWCEGTTRLQQSRCCTVSTGSPVQFEAAGVAPDGIKPALRTIYKEVTDKVPGGQILTGPVYVEGAPSPRTATRAASIAVGTSHPSARTR